MLGCGVVTSFAGIAGKQGFGSSTLADFTEQRKLLRAYAILDRKFLLHTRASCQEKPLTTSFHGFGIIKYQMTKFQWSRLLLKTKEKSKSFDFYSFSCGNAMEFNIKNNASEFLLKIL